MATKESEYFMAKLNSIKNSLSDILNNILFSNDSDFQFIGDHISKKNIMDKLKSPFSPELIMKDINDNYNYYKKYVFTYNQIIIEIIILNNISNINLKDIIIMGLKGITFINEFLQYSTVTLYYIPTNYKKQLSNTSNIEPINTNSGFTTTGISNPYICIYREEEHDKVFLHELIHYLYLDFHTFQMEDIDIKSMKNYDYEIMNPLINHVNLFETYTDFMAIVYNSMINSIIHNQSVIDILNLELIYQTDRACMILDKFGMDHIIKEKNTKNKKLKQSTNVLSYYILKTALTDNYMDVFLKFKLGDTWTKDKINFFYSYIYDTLSNKMFVNSVIDKNYRYEKKKYVNNDTMKMTLMYS